MPNAPLALRARWPLALVLAGGACRSDARASQPAVDSSVEGTAPAQAVQTTCPSDLAEGAQCGTVRVFENRETRQGTTIDLAYVVLPAKAVNAANRDPVFVLAGGPGQAATRITALADDSLRQANEVRDLVFVDQRGTGASNGLHCGPTDLEGMLHGPWSEANAGLVAACVTSLPADLAQYATPTAMDDLDDVRVALGYETVNLWGGSYGTRAGLAYLRRHGEHVRSAVFWGVAPPGRPFPRTFAPAGQAALERVLADCKADAGCHAVLPDGMAVVERIIERLARQPAVLTVRDPRDGREVSAKLTRAAFVGGVRLVLYDASWSAGLPAMLAAADQGDFQPLMRLLAPLVVGILTEIHFGMFLSVVCAEDVPLLTAADDEAARQTFVGDDILVGLRRACEAWPRAELPDGYLSSVHSDVPILLMAGELDPVTPPPTARAAAQYLTRSRVVAFPNVGHGGSNAGPCRSRTSAGFFPNDHRHSLAPDAGLRG